MARQQFFIEARTADDALVVARDLVAQGFDVDLDPKADHVSDHPVEMVVSADHRVFTNASPNSPKAKADAAAILGRAIGQRGARQGQGRRTRPRPQPR